MKIVNSSFEDWSLQADSFDLAIAADSFHWISPEIGYLKVARALKSTGSAAFFWNTLLDPAANWSQAVEEVYRSISPDLENPDNPSMLDHNHFLRLKNITMTTIAIKQTAQNNGYAHTLSSSGKYLKFIP